MRFLHVVIKYIITCRRSNKGNGNGNLDLTFSHETSKALRHGSHSFTCKQHHACLYFVKVHPMALPLTCDNVCLIAAYYSSIDPERMKGPVGLVV